MAFYIFLILILSHDGIMQATNGCKLFLIHQVDVIAHN